MNSIASTITALGVPGIALCGIAFSGILLALRYKYNPKGGDTVIKKTMNFLFVLGVLGSVIYFLLTYQTNEIKQESKYDTEIHIKGLKKGTKARVETN